MAKKKDAVSDPPVEIPPTEPEPELPVLESDGKGRLQTITLIGGGSGDGFYRTASPIPQTIAANGVTYDLSNRADGIYIFRHK